MPSSIAADLAAVSHPIRTVDPEAPGDDLAFLADLVGSARVVGIGEFAHGIHECYLSRHRLLRYLVEQLGFNVFALESGFSEGVLVDSWIRGASGQVRDVSLRGTTYAMGACQEFESQLAWMRAHNQAGGSLAYCGLDLPGASISYLSAIDALSAFLDTLDPTAKIRLEPARAVCLELRGLAGFRAYQAYAALDQTLRDSATAALADLDRHLAAARVEAHDEAWQHLRLARALDDGLRAGPLAVGQAREGAMAATVTWLLERDPGARVVIGAHNAHLQRLPMAVPGSGGALPAQPMLGSFLDAQLGPDYLCVATTAGSGVTRSHLPDAEAPLGVRMGEVAVESRVDSLEAALEAAGGACLADLRPLRDAHSGSVWTRLNEHFVEFDALRAYDAVVQIPQVRLVDATAPFAEAFIGGSSAG